MDFIFLIKRTNFYFNSINNYNFKYFLYPFNPRNQFSSRGLLFSATCMMTRFTLRTVVENFVHCMHVCAKLFLEMKSVFIFNSTQHNSIVQTVLSDISSIKSRSYIKSKPRCRQRLNLKRSLYSVKKCRRV